MYRTTTDDSGGFTLSELKPGRYVVEAGATNRYGGPFLVQVSGVGGSTAWRQAKYSTTYWKGSGTDEQWTEISLRPKDKLGNLGLQLGWSIGPRVQPDVELGDSNVRVRIIDRTTRKPVPHAELSLWRLPPIRSGGTHAPIISTLADDSGVVLFSGLAAGEYDIYVERIGYSGASFKVHSTATLDDPAILEILPSGAVR